MELPRFSPRVEHWVLRVACGLPPALQRLLAGPPLRGDGQELASDIQVLLRLRALAGGDSVTEATQPAEARARNRAEALAAAGPPRPMAEVRGLEVEGATGSLAARLYLPSAEPRRRPLLVYFHGGGWVLGDLDTHDGACRFLAAEAGMPVLSIDYRLAPEHRFPAPVEDAHAAFAWAVAHAEELGGDPGRIAVGGDSAGANIAAAVSLVARDGGGPAPAMQLLIYPVADTARTHRSRDLFAEGFLLTKADMDWFERHYLPDEGAARDPRVSLLAAEDLAGLPPTYVATAGFDPLRDEAEAYAERLRAAGCTVALRRHPGLIHGFANMTAISRSARAAMHEAAGALRMGLA